MTTGTMTKKEQKQQEVEEAKEQLWKRRNDEDFEERSMNLKNSFFLVMVQITIRVLHRHNSEIMKILLLQKSKYPIF
jgi:hypothetical protein